MDALERVWKALGSSSDLGAVEICARLILAFLLTSAIAAVYTRSYKGYGRPGQMALVLVLVSQATCGIIMAIGHNLALSLGMVGALSIVRFRAAVKDNRDLAYLFWTIAIGLVCGAGGYLLAILLLVILGAGVGFLERLQLFKAKTRSHIVILSQLRAAGAAPPSIDAVLPSGSELRSSIYQRDTGIEESTFLVEFADPRAIEVFKQGVQAETSLTGYQILGPEDAILG